MSWQGQLISSLILLKDTWLSFGNNIFTNPQVPLKRNNFQADLIICLINIRNLMRSNSTLVLSGNFEVDVIGLIKDTALNFGFSPIPSFPVPTNFTGIISVYLRRFSDYLSSFFPPLSLSLDWQSYVLQSIKRNTFVSFRFPRPSFPIP